jgi:hypothetical protein
LRFMVRALLGLRWRMRFPHERSCTNGQRIRSLRSADSA